MAKLTEVKTFEAKHYKNGVLIREDSITSRMVGPGEKTTKELIDCLVGEHPPTVLGGLVIAYDLKEEAVLQDVRKTLGDEAALAAVHLLNLFTAQNLGQKEGTLSVAGTNVAFVVATDGTVVPIKFLWGDAEDGKEKWIASLRPEDGLEMCRKGARVIGFRGPKKK